MALDGTLVYATGPRSQEQLLWRDRRGESLGKIGQAQDHIRYPVLSPDGRRVVVMGEEHSNRDIWIHEVDRPVKTRLTFHPAVDITPTWSPDGQRVAFSSGRGEGRRNLYVKTADESAEPRELLAGPSVHAYLTDWSADEKLLLYYRIDPETGEDLGYLQRTDDGSYESVAFLQTRFRERTPQLSPDGRFVAYVSDESGQFQVLVQRFPEGGGKQQVSQHGGTQPRWRSDGKELFYVEGDTLVAVRVTTTPKFSIGASEKLFQSEGLQLRNDNALGYDVTPDGQRFVVWEPVEQSGTPSIRVVQNWYEEFRDREQD